MLSILIVHYLITVENVYKDNVVVKCIGHQVIDLEQVNQTVYRNVCQLPIQFKFRMQNLICCQFSLGLYTHWRYNEGGIRPLPYVWLFTNTILKNQHLSLAYF